MSFGITSVDPDHVIDFLDEVVGNLSAGIVVETAYQHGDGSVWEFFHDLMKDTRVFDVAVDVAHFVVVPDNLGFV